MATKATPVRKSGKKPAPRTLGAKPKGKNGRMTREELEKAIEAIRKKPKTAKPSPAVGPGAAKKPVSVKKKPSAKKGASAAIQKLPTATFSPPPPKNTPKSGKMPKSVQDWNYIGEYKGKAVIECPELPLTPPKGVKKAWGIDGVNRIERPNFILVSKKLAEKIQGQMRRQYAPTIPKSAKVPE